MTSYIQIQWTAQSMDEAKSIGKALVEKRWVACVNVIPTIYSIYLWKGNLEEGEEVKVLLKTMEPFFDRVRGYILTHASYDVPEISCIEIVKGNPDYIRWIQDTLNERLSPYILD